jgi:hypothetical protein
MNPLPEGVQALTGKGSFDILYPAARRAGFTAKYGGDTDMYKHIGRKVRGLAVALCLIGVVGSIGTGVYMFVEKILDWPLCIAAGVDLR